MVGAVSHIVLISIKEFEHIKVELEEAKRIISQKQNELKHTKQRALVHQQQLQEQLTTAINR